MKLHELNLVFLFFLSQWTVFNCQKNVKLLVITETRAEGVAQHLSEGISVAEKMYSSKIKLNMDVVPLLRDNENESFSHVCSKGSGGISAILDLTWSGWDKMDSLAKASNIPIIKVDVSIRPFVKALNDFVTFRNGTDSALIFETETELDQALYYLIGHSILRVVVIEKLSPKNVKGLAGMRPTASFHSIFASTKEMQNMLKKAQEGDLIKRDGRWNLLFTDFKYETFNITGIKILINLLTMKKEVCCSLRNLNDNCICPDNFELIPSFLLNFGSFFGNVMFELYSQNNVNLLNKIDCSLSESSSESKNDSNTEFKNILLKLLSKQNLLSYDSSENLVYYKSTMDVYVANESQKTQLGTWNTEEGFALNPGQYLDPDKRFFRIGIVPEDEPWSYQVLDEKTGELVWKGYCVDLVQKLAEVMNFDFEFKIPDVGKFGKKLRNGRWDGVVGELSRGETDIVVVSLIMTSEREEIIDFVAPYYYQSGISIIIRKPIRQTSLFKFMTVLRVEVWVAILGALSVTGIMIWFLDKYSPYSARNNKESYPYPCREFTLKESFWFALTSFTPQGGGEAPKALSGRTLVAAYWLFVVLMLATFTANLAAFLTVERMKSPVESLEQLARQSRINYTVVKDGEAHKFFVNMKKAEDTLYKAWKELALNATSDETQYRVWDYPIKEQYGHILLAIEQTGLVDNESVGFQKVLDSEKGEFAFIHDEAIIKYYTYKNCNFTEVGEVFAERPYAVAVQQGSQLQEEISRRILDLQKERYFEGRIAKYWNSTETGNCPNTDDSEGITLGSLGGVFIATLFGLALAMITLAGEILYHKHKNTADQKVNKIKPENKVDPAEYSSYISRIPHSTRVTLNKKLTPSYRPTGAGKMMPRVSYISVFPRNPPIFD